MRILSELSTFKFLGAISLRSPFGARDHAMVRLSLHTGLRVSELVGLDVGDVYQAGAARQLLDLPPAIAKGHKSRRIPLSSTARRAIVDLVEFLKMLGFSCAPEAPLLQDRRHRRLSVREVQRLVQKYRELAGLDLKVTPHSLRHSWASQLARASTLPVVQQLLGHRFLSSTQVYLHTRPEDLEQAVDQLPELGLDQAVGE